MYETEANHRFGSSDEIPAGVKQELSELRETLIERTVLPWSEHCTECVWPTCYTTCDIYSPREDGRCRRFASGMVRVACPQAVNAYLLKIEFKQWGKLWSPANLRLHSAAQAERMERTDYRIGSVLYQLPAPAKIKGFVTGKRYNIKKKSASRPASGGNRPTSFLMECYNPGSSSVRMSLTMRPAEGKASIPFQRLIELEPGFHRVRVPLKEIDKLVDVEKPFGIELIPNDVENLLTLYFGLIDFVREKEQVPVNSRQAPRKQSKVKCVVWDLDNTLWSGILVEDGPGKVTLKPNILDVIRTLDERGILQSVASKNEPAEAIAALKQFGIDDYFLCPQISWRPKSQGISAIARQLNIGVDTLLFVDDSEFELQEVRAAHPEIRVLDALRYLTLPELEDCQVPVTEESKERRKMYQVETARRDAQAGFANEYMAFLRHCQIQLLIRPMTEQNLDRVHELTQRTNQMNFSGNRYDRSVLQEILATPYLDTYVLSCEDLFGSYGIVGFCVVDVREPRMTDLMFSCRVQSKRIEHAFLGHIICKYIAASGRDFFANYRKTPRNAPSGQVFADLGMEEVELKNDVTTLVFRKDREVPDDGVIAVAVEEAATRVI
jgi:FkbH-like protein